MNIQKTKLGEPPCKCGICPPIKCGECKTLIGDGFRIQDCGGCIILCSACLATLRSKIDALTILVQTGADTK